MKAELDFNGGAAFNATAGSGHSMVLDGSPDIGGQDLGARPMEMVLIGMGGCMGMDIVHILGKSRQKMTGLKITLDAERAPEPPAVFTRVHLHLVVSGEDLRESAVERAIELSAEKYCSATIMIGKTAEITHSFEIVEQKLGQD